MNKFKVGDWVSSNYFDGVKQIEKRRFDLNLIESFEYFDSSLTLVCGFVKGETILAGDSKACLEKRVFDSYRQDLKFPFVVLNPYEISICSFKYAKAIEKYKAYSEPKLEWIGKEVATKSKNIFTIYGIVRENQILLTNRDEFTLQGMFETFTWLDGSPFGELIQ